MNEPDSALRKLLENLKGKAVEAQFSGGKSIEGNLVQVFDDCMTFAGGYIGVVSQLAWIRKK
jgi:hypothetical protein